MKIAITGASGHIGSVLCRKLIEQGHEVTALVRNSTKSLEGLPLIIQKGNVLDINSLRLLLKNQDVVIHAAGLIRLGYKFDQQLYDVNVQGTKNIFDISKEMNIKKIIHFSSIHVYKQKPYNLSISEEREFVDENSVFYDQTKRDAHLLAIEAAQGGQNVSIICPTAVIGPHDYMPSKLGRAIKAIHRGLFPVMLKGGFDFVDVRDVADATIQTIETGESGETYIVGGNYHTLKELSDIILKIKGKKRGIIEVPAFLGRIGIPFIRIYSGIVKKDPIFDNVYLNILLDGNKNIDSEKAVKTLNHRKTELEKTLKDTIDWFQNGKNESENDH